MNYSFIDSNPESSSFSIYSVFHYWCFHSFEKDKAVMNRLAMIIVAAAAPENNSGHKEVNSGSDPGWRKTYDIHRWMGIDRPGE